jgi:hypothetical protein
VHDAEAGQTRYRGGLDPSSLLRSSLAWPASMAKRLAVYPDPCYSQACTMAAILAGTLHLAPALLRVDQAITASAGAQTSVEQA